MIHAYGFPLRLVAEVDGELLDVTDALEYAVTTSTIHVNNQNLLDSIAHYQRISKPPILYQEKPRRVDDMALFTSTYGDR